MLGIRYEVGLTKRILRQTTEEPKIQATPNFRSCLSQD